MVPSPARRFRAVTTGWRHTCAIATSGGAFCWGFNAQGQLGLGAPGAPVSFPTAVAGALVFDGLSAGSSHTCGVDSGRGTYCWGLNGAGQIGTGVSGGVIPTPTAVLKH